MRQDNRMLEAVIIAFLMCLALLWAGKAWSDEIVNSSRLADAIYKAEGGAIAKPYGILKDYCKRGDPDGQCRKGCIQTIDKWKRKLSYVDADSFIRQFAEVYAPTKNATNDPMGLNNNWLKNVLHFYRKYA